MTSRERDILSVLEDAIDQAADVLPDYLTSDELLEFTGLDRHLTKRELGRLMSGAGLRSRGKRIDRTVTKVYAGADILAAIRDRGVPAPATASTPDSVTEAGSVASDDQLAAVRDRTSGKVSPDPDPVPPRRTTAVKWIPPTEDTGTDQAVAEAGLATDPSGEGCGLPFIKNANFALSSAVQVGDPIDARDLDKAQTYIDQLREAGLATDPEAAPAENDEPADEATQDAGTSEPVPAADASDEDILIAVKSTVGESGKTGVSATALAKLTGHPAGDITRALAAAAVRPRRGKYDTADLARMDTTFADFRVLAVVGDYWHEHTVRLHQSYRPGQNAYHAAWEQMNCRHRIPDAEPTDDGSESCDCELGVYYLREGSSTVEVIPPNHWTDGAFELPVALTPFATAVPSAPTAEPAAKAVPGDSGSKVIVLTFPAETPGDEILREVAAALGIA